MRKAAYRLTSPLRLSNISRFACHTIIASALDPGVKMGPSGFQWSRLSHHSRANQQAIYHRRSAIRLVSVEGRDTRENCNGESNEIEDQSKSLASVSPLGRSGT